MRFFLFFALLFLSGCGALSSLQKANTIGETTIIASHDFIELDKIARISKFRSGYGHDFSYASNETCRSMKHYFEVANGVNPLTVKYFSPVDGAVTGVQTQTNEHDIAESRFAIRADKNRSLYFLFFHVSLASDIKEGSRVSTGEYLGTIGHPEAHGEIAVEYRKRGAEGLLSWFDVIENELSQSYAEHGVNKENIIIKKERRDANPLACDPNTPDGRFIPVSGQMLGDFQKWQAGEGNWVQLKGTGNE